MVGQRELSGAALRAFHRDVAGSVVAVFSEAWSFDASKTSLSTGSGLDSVKASAAADASDKNPRSLESACSGAFALSSQRTVTPIAVPMPSSRFIWKTTPQIGG
jgi:hypothetical protein